MNLMLNQDWSKPSTYVNHPMTFAAGVGVANGLLAIGRGKKIDVKTAVTLSLILGLGEMALVYYEPQEHRGPIMSKMTLGEIGVQSVLGVMLGIAPFVTWGGVHHGEQAKPLLVAEANAGREAVRPQLAGVGGWR